MMYFIYATRNIYLWDKCVKEDNFLISFVYLFFSPENALFPIIDLLVWWKYIL